MLHETELSQAPHAADWLQVSTLRDVSRMAAMRAEWDALLQESNAGAFNAWEWVYPWCRRVAPERQPFVLMARDRSGTLVGLLALGLDERRVLGRRVRRLAFLGETHVGSDYLDVVARRGAEDAVTRAFASVLRDAEGKWDVLDLTDLREDSPTVAALSEAFADREVMLDARYVCPYETLDPRESFDAFLQRTGRRDNYLRRRRWLERQEGYRIERVEAPGELAGPMTEFFRLHASRWAADGGSQGIKGSGVEAFHRDATQYLAERGRLRFYTMKVWGRAVASVYGLVHRGTFIYFQSGYDPSWRHRSVGLVLVGETFRDALAEGLTEYDFLRGTETYKSDWVTKQRRTVSLRIHAASGAGRWFTSAEDAARRMRGAVKQVMPERFVERVRRLRRRRAAVS
ncbi:GNAT family N-acetyltransferase [Myxococcaceae bacterium GXIMD 01537]